MLNTFKKWWAVRFKTLKQGQKRGNARRPFQWRLSLEELEHRSVPSAYPSCIIDAPIANSFINTNMPTLVATAAEDPSGSGLASVQFQISSNGGTTWNNVGSPEAGAPFRYAFATALSDGAYEARAVATDNAGNSTTSMPTVFTIDTVAPTVAVTSAANGSFTNNAIPTLTATAADNPGGSGLASVQFQYSSDGGASWINAGSPDTTAPFTYTFASPLADGNYAFRAVATDNAGNMASSAPNYSAANALSTLGTFYYSTPNSYSNLVEDSSGNLFGTIAGGGAYADGAVFEVQAGTDAMTLVASFNRIDGSGPQAGVIEDGSGNLFGTTYSGGYYGYGTVFEIAQGSGSITVLASFNGANGADPVDSLIEDSNGNLFGTTEYGGASGTFGAGTVFEVVRGSGAITTLASFNGANGANPRGGLVEDSNGNLFGTTSVGYTASAGPGTVFEIVHGSGTITTLASFNGANGYSPLATLVEDSSGNLFGTTKYGGIGNSNNGTVFELVHGSGAITTLASFNGTNGAGPVSSLVEDGNGNLFGTTSGNAYGTHGNGTIFEVVAGSGAATTLVAFNGTNGASPEAGLIEDGSGNFFGTTAYGGASGEGTVFELAHGSSTISTLSSFVDASGYSPEAPLIQDASGNLFGTTAFGGAWGGGTVFEIARGSTQITTIASFNGSNGASPHGGLVEDASGNLFGTTYGGGASGEGTVFEIARGSAAISTVVSFNGVNGIGPQGGLVEDSSGDLFGATAEGGAFNDGTIFEIAYGSGTVTTLASFNSVNGDDPGGSLVADGSGNLFGSTYLGGSYDLGTVFEIAHGSGAITTVVSFNEVNGANPQGGLVEDGNGNLFGTTQYQGAFNAGTVYEIASGSGTVTTLASFNVTDGAAPEAGLIEDGNGNFFGTTSSGGLFNDGTVFELARGSRAITTLASLNGTNGSDPLAGLFEDGGGNLFGTTFSGTYDNGTVFELANTSPGFTIDTTPPTAVITSAPPVLGNNSTAVFTFTASDPIVGGVSSGVNRLQYSLDGGSFAQTNNSLTLTGLANGMHLVKVQAIDNAGNAGPAASFSWTVSTTAPTIGISSPANFSFTNNNRPVVTASAAVGAGGTGLAAVQFQYSADGGLTWQSAGVPDTTAPFSYTFPTALADGAYQVRAIASDNAGNSTTSTAATFTIDTAAPSVTITSPTNNSFTNNTQPTLTATAADNPGGSGLAGVQFQYSTDGGASWSNAGALETSAPFAYTFASPLNEGVYAIRAVATDNAGNTSISATAHAGTNVLTTLAAFAYSTPVGDSNLIEDPSGDLFGTAAYGGSAGAGMIFEIARGSAAITTLASFTGTNGAHPAAGLIADGSGNLFGVAAYGGAYGKGTVFELVHGGGAIITLASFNGANGANPSASLVEDSRGDLFGTASAGGAFGDGTVFEVVQGSAAITTLASFNGTNGATPKAGLVRDSNGNLFGSTYGGGASGVGTVFEIPQGGATITTLASFNNANGADPLAGLIEDSSGNLFGTTSYGGSSNAGTVFEIAEGSLTVTTLASFYGKNGVDPQGALVEDSSGNLFGTTAYGGASNAGTIFEVIGGSGAATPLASFNGANGSDPKAGLWADTNGNLFGATYSGGPANAGTVFELTGSASLSFTVDTTAPTAAITTAPSPFTNNSTATFDFTGSDPTSGNVAAGIKYLEYSLFGGSSTPVQSPLTLTGLQDGTHTLEVQAVDNAGNVGPVTSYSWTVDTAAPTVSLVAPARNSVTNNGRLMLAATAADNAGGSGLASVQFQYSANGGTTWTNAGAPEAIAPFIYTFPTALADGTYTIRAVATDNAGNRTASTLTTVVIDTVAPTVTISSLANSFPANGAEPTLTATAADNPGGSGLASVQFQYSGNGGASWNNAGGPESLAPFTYTFPTPLPQGNYAFRVLAVDKAGNTATSATIYAGTRSLTSLAAFHYSAPESVSGLIEDSSGNLFGTTESGGASGLGTVFEIMHGSGLVTTLISFNGLNGANPCAGLVEDSSGNLYGTTMVGGASRDGTVFEIAHGATTVATLASFNGADGAYPVGGLILDSGGNLLGTTEYGGSFADGTIFELAHGGGLLTLAVFNGINGAEPKASLIEDSSGNLFGDTAAGGPWGAGTVFELVHGSAALTVIASFNGANGSHPVADLMEDRAGNLFGTAEYGGAAGAGTIFEVVHGSSTVTTLVSLNGTNGAHPVAGLVEDNSGNLFGTTLYGGAASAGTVFEIVRGSSTVTTLVSFNSVTGTNPDAGLVEDGSGDLFGTTAFGGAYGDGSVYEI